MRVETKVLDYDSNVAGERIGMTIDQGALAHIMSVLTDLYSDPEAAVIREYATNALDSHIEAKQRRPIEVTLPSQLSPFFKVRDYGLGLDADGIRDVFSRYGTSTKRESNDVVGMLGLGCKSALTYSDQFTLIGVRAGRKVTVLVSRDENGAGSMTIVDDSPTADPAGVEVVIPAKRENQFAAKATAFFRFWQADTVLVNGVAPDRVNGLWLSDSLLLSSEVSADTVVQGNVPYPFPDGTQRNRGYGSTAPALVAFVPIGSVQFTPSREALQATKRTVAYCENLKAQVQPLLDAAAVQREVGAAATATEAQAKLREGLRAGFKGSASWQGHTVMLTLERTPAKPASFTGNYWSPPDPGDSAAQSLLVVGAQYGRRKGERRWHVDLDPALTWFEGYDSRDMTPTKREKLEVWASQRGLTLGKCVMLRQLTAAEKVWLDTASVHDWSQVDAVKLTRDARAANVNGRPRGSYDALVNGDWQTVQADEIDTAAPIYWLHGNQHCISAHTGLRQGFVAKAGATIVPLPANRIDRFCRDFPAAVNLDTAARKAAAASIDALDPAAVKAYRIQLGSDIASLKCLDPDQLTDPDLQRLVRVAQVDTTKVNETFRAARDWLAGTAQVQPLQEDWRMRYPLLQGTYGLHKLQAHAYAYCNAMHALREAEAQAEVAA